MGLRMKNFDIFGVPWKIWLLGGWGSQKTYIEGGFPKKGGGGGLGQFADLRGGLGKKDRGSVYEGGLIPWCTICSG